MLDSLKDLQISYPFFPVAVKPEWFDSIKDARLTVVLGAANAISEYNLNDNCVKVVLTGIDAAGQVAHFRVRCSQLSGVDIPVDANLFEWTTACPSTGSYVIVDRISALSSVPVSGLDYVMNPDILVFMQNAPVIRYNTVQLSDTVAFRSGHNVTASLTATGIALYGAIGGGLGVYTAYPAGSTVSNAKQNLGASSINGIQGAVWLDGTYPLKAQAYVDANGDAIWNITQE